MRVLSRIVKNVLIVNLDNLEDGKLLPTCHGFKVCMGAHYIGGYIRDNDPKQDCLKERKATWEQNIFMIK